MRGSRRTVVGAARQLQRLHPPHALAEALQLRPQPLCARAPPDLALLGRLLPTALPLQAATLAPALAPRRGGRRGAAAGAVTAREGACGQGDMLTGVLCYNDVLRLLQVGQRLHCTADTQAICGALDAPRMEQECIMHSYGFPLVHSKLGSYCRQAVKWGQCIVHYADPAVCGTCVVELRACMRDLSCVVGRLFRRRQRRQG